MAQLVEVTVGVIGRAHGVRGDVNVEPRTDEIERRFAAGSTMRTDQGESLTVADFRQPSGRLIVTFTEVADRTAAEKLRGRALVMKIAPDERPSGHDEYFDRQLVGLRVLGTDGRARGTISGVVHGPAQDLLVVDVDQDERMVPFVRALVPVVDVDAGSVQLADVPGLLDDEVAEA
ncbi:ribosome maturation factor RimM [Propionimicrobium sp. PCR01-08-3]|uniref:ribosome maturation factor RimM n=1 Tax=Propionimicrobium sp. PCR01-08-3 TaxID=3052086 RepID=UPI00255CA344|nr:ribosome maturation factor RimM [Propionimicrobium sp. PCR01-08-3]WIY81534.1 ribosome maturation factor RimM [Propionimicrobium sp. PCR01-08-3]